jgi:branched-chain amino acid transport system ATP-binding protein
MNDRSPLLAIQNLKVSYGRVSALKGIDLQVFSNEIVALVGSNGAGKSTLLNTIIGLVSAQSGSVEFKENEITGLPPYRIINRGITLIPEGRRVFPDQNVDDNLLLGAYSLRGSKRKEEVARKKSELYKMFPILEKRKKQLAGTLSGGEQQMLALARGLMSDPDLLMLDEPSLGLAPILVEGMFEAIKQLKKQKKTIFLVEQMAWMALEICDRAYVLQTGNIIREGTGEELLRDSQLLEAYLGRRS